MRVDPWWQYAAIAMFALFVMNVWPHIIIYETADQAAIKKCNSDMQLANELLSSCNNRLTQCEDKLSGKEYLSTVVFGWSLGMVSMYGLVQLWHEMMRRREQKKRFEELERKEILQERINDEKSKP
jgi:hypothetical protein